MTTGPNLGPSLTTDVLVVGGGPAGAAAGYWLAQHGHDVTIVERRTYPRAKTCGDALTPRAVHQLRDMGLADELHRFHHVDGIRATGMGRSVDVMWPSHSDYPDFGLVARRSDLDNLVARHAEANGVHLLDGHQAMLPLVERGFVHGATVQHDAGESFGIAARYVVVADGANSRFGRALGTFRTRGWPYATAIRGYWQSPRHADPMLESALDLTDRNGQPIPGYGWVFPLGDGTINVGVGLLSTFRDFKSVNTSHLLTAYAERIAESWHIDPDAPIDKPVSGRIPLGGSVGPKAGPTYLVVGDASGVVNPFNGEGIAYGFETGRLAAQVLHEALESGDSSALQRYPQLLDDAYGDYFKIARLFARLVGHPTIMRELTRVGMHSTRLLETSVRLMAGMLRPDELGPAELTYKAAATLMKLAPNT